MCLPRLLQQRRQQKHGIMKAPVVLMNIFRKIGGKSKGKKGVQQQQQQQSRAAPTAAQLHQEDGDTAPNAVPAHTAYAVV